MLPAIEEIRNPIYQHLLLSHLPIAGLAIATLALGIGLCMKFRAAQIPALLVILIAAAAA